MKRESPSTRDEQLIAGYSFDKRVDHSAKALKLLFIGDVVGATGMRAMLFGLPGMIKQYSPDLVVVNGENADKGYGIAPEQAEQLFSLGTHVITTGNHVWQNPEMVARLDSEQRVLRPANYPPSNPGHGVSVVTVQGRKVAVINLQGRTRMPSIDCPFRKLKELVRKLPTDVEAIMVDFHAEAVAEKEAFAFHVDGLVGAVIGTHTHVQTTDERILPKGTAYITDVGATCCGDSVIGFDPEISVARARTQMPIRNAPADGPALICGLLLELADGQAQSVERIRREAGV